MGLKRGDIIRWIIDYDGFEVDTDVVRPIDPVYGYGIIIKVSNENPHKVAVYQINKMFSVHHNRRKSDDVIKHLHIEHDVLEMISEG